MVKTIHCIIRDRMGKISFDSMVISDQDDEFEDFDSFEEYEKYCRSEKVAEFEQGFCTAMCFEMTEITQIAKHFGLIENS